MTPTLLELESGATAIADVYREAEPETSRLTTVSLFTGAGGLDLGLEAAGFDTRFASDIDHHSICTLRRGQETARKLGKRVLEHAVISDPTDVRVISGFDILRSTGMEPGEIDLLAGGPPCQAFSVFGKRQGLKDPRGQLAYEYMRLLNELRPKAFLLENVAGMLTIDGGQLLKQLVARLSKPGPGLDYAVTVLRLNAVDYGVPQFRDRVFVIGHAGGKSIFEIAPLFSDPAPIRQEALELSPRCVDEKQAWRTVRDALRGLPRIGSPYPDNHVGRIHSARIIERYGELQPGERDHHTRINKLDLDRPSFTIVVGSDKGGGKGHVHPTEPRELTPRESARIQTFPDWWSFSGTSRHPIRQVGNAVPPLLGAAVGGAMKKALFGQATFSHVDIVATLDQQHLFSDAERASFGRK